MIHYPGIHLISAAPCPTKWDHVIGPPVHIQKHPGNGQKTYALTKALEFDWLM